MGCFPGPYSEFNSDHFNTRMMKMAAQFDIKHISLNVFCLASLNFLPYIIILVFPENDFVTAISTAVVVVVVVV